MSQTYFALLTEIGETKLAKAATLGTPLSLTAMGVGDGNGTTPTPTRQQTALVNEVRRQPLNQLLIDPKNSNYIIAEQVIPENEGGWWISEIGLYDEAGNLCAVSNAPPTYKPLLAEGSGRTQVIRMVLMINEGHTQAITLKTDPSIVLATHEYVINVMSKHSQSEDPHPQYATKHFVNNAVLLSMPAGCVMFFACQNAPIGWLKCNGAAISRTIYANLFDAIGSTFGDGDGSTTFNLPDLRGEFLRGWDENRGIDNQRAFGSWQNHDFLSHTHNTPTTNGIDQAPGREVPFGGNHGYDYHDTIGTIPTQATGGNETRPRNIALLTCIKY